MLVGAGNGKSSAVSLRMGSERSAEDLPPEWQWAFRERFSRVKPYHSTYRGRSLFLLDVTNECDASVASTEVNGPYVH